MTTEQQEKWNEYKKKFDTLYEKVLRYQRSINYLNENEVDNASIILNTDTSYGFMKMDKVMSVQVPDEMAKEIKEKLILIYESKLQEAEEELNLLEKPKL